MNSEQFGFLVLGALILYLIWKDRAADANGAAEPKNIQQVSIPAKLTDEKIIRREKQFEQHFGSNLPDVPSARELYIYQSMMRPWFHKLSARHRYDDERVGKLRDDWYDYLEAVDERSLSHWLCWESSGQESHSHRNDAQLADRKAFLIEEAFSVAIGDFAVRELSQVRKLERSDFEQRDSVIIRLKNLLA
jgi:hypothetical protein